MPSLARVSLPSSDSDFASVRYDHLSLSPISLPIRVDHPNRNSTSHDVSLELEHDDGFSNTSATSATLSLELRLSRPDELRFAALATDYSLEIVHLSAPIFLAPDPASPVSTKKDETVKKAADREDVEAVLEAKVKAELEAKARTEEQRRPGWRVLTVCNSCF